LKVSTGRAAGKADLVLYLNPAWVVTKTLPQRGVEQPFQICAPLRVTVDYDRLRYDVSLNQPFRASPRGNDGLSFP
jgi:hypothetical protein